MKGLLLKDFYSLKTEYKMYGIMLPFLVGFMTLMNFNGTGDSVTGGFGYLVSYAVIAALGLTMNSFTYDEKFGYTQYALATPTSRKQYVGGKYVFHLINAGAAAILGLVIMLVMSVFFRRGLQYGELMGALVFAGGCLGAALVMGVWQIGLSIRFDSVKARLIFVGIVLGVTALGIGTTMYSVFEEKDGLLFIPVVVGVAFLAATIWMFCMSFVWMKKKEF